MLAIGRRILLPGLLPLAPMLAVLLVVHATVAPATIPAIALAGLAGAVVYTAGYLLLPATVSERAIARQLIVLSRRALNR
jgi:hypothetical protein